MLVCFPFLVGAISAVAYGQSPSPSAGVEPPLRLALHDAEQLALKNNPQITVAKLLTLAQGELTREVRAAELPQASGNLTAVDPREGSRITAGGLNNPILFQRAAGGVTIGQLITDFGRTSNLVASQKLRERAGKDAERATAADIVLAVDQAFFQALEAQSLLNVAQQTVDTRQFTADQIQALANAKLKSDLDLSFAKVNLAQAKLLQLDAQNRHEATLSQLNEILGFEKQASYELIDETSKPLLQPSENEEDLVSLALRSRPDLAELDDQWQAAERFRRAEHDLQRPVVSALGAVGGTPVRDHQLASSAWYGAAGVNVNIPIFNGFLFSARAKEADYRSSVLKEQVRGLRDRIARDVRLTWLQANTAFQRLSVSEQLLQQANLALDLAQTRYKIGLSSIVELSQAQLQQTEAAISNTNARYDYQSALAALTYQTGQ